MTAKKDNNLPDFPKMSIAILENLVRPILGDSVIKLLRTGLDNKELDKLLDDALSTTEKRFINEHEDAEICDFLRQLPWVGLLPVERAAKIFYNRPTDPTLSYALAKVLAQGMGHIVSKERIDKAVATFLRIFQEELAISSPQMREKLNALATLRSLESSSQARNKGDVIMGNKIEISNSTIGMLNSGEIKNVEHISVNVTNLEASGKNDIAQAIKEITEALANSSEISLIQREEILEQLQEISKQATLSKEQRSAPGVLKAIFSSLGTTIGTVASLAQIWSTWGIVISKFFGF